MARSTRFDLSLEFIIRRTYQLASYEVMLRCSATDSSRFTFIFLPGVYAEGKKRFFLQIIGSCIG